MNIFQRIFGRHWRDFQRALRSEAFEVTQNGIVFLKEQAIGRGFFRDYVNGRLIGVEQNLLVNQGLTYLLGAAMGATSKEASWYIALWNGAVNPQASWTAANFASNATEITSATEGYTETTRPEWVDDPAASQTINNAGSLATFTIATASELSVEGAAILSDSAKGSTAGILVGASRYSSTRKLKDGDNYKIQYGVQLSG